MENLAINITSITVLLLSFFLFRRAAGSMSLVKVNLVSYSFYVQLFLLSFIGAFLVINNIDNHYVIAKIRNQESARFMGWMAIMYTMIMMPIGMLLAKKVFKIASAKEAYNDYCYRPIKAYISSRDTYVRTMLYAFSLIALLAVVYTYASLPQIPILEALRGASDLTRLRIQASMEFSGNVYVRNILAIQLTPVLAYISFAYYMKTKRTTDLIWSVSFLILSFFILIYDLQKSPFALFLLGYVFLFILINGKIPWRYLSLFGGMAILLIVVMYGLVLGGFEDFSLKYNEGVMGRTFLSQIAGTFVSFDIFPRLYEHIGFDSLSNWLSIFNIETQERAARKIMTYINPAGVAAGTAGVQNTLFIGEAWANFAWYGLLIAPIYVGFFLGAIYYFFLRAPKTPIYLGFFTFFSGQNMVIGGFNDFIYNMAYLSLLFVFMFILSTAKAWYYKVNPTKELKDA